MEPAPVGALRFSCVAHLYIFSIINFLEKNLQIYFVTKKLVIHLLNN
jgi:hypothetical protein